MTSFRAVDPLARTSPAVVRSLPARPSARRRPLLLLVTVAAAAELLDVRLEQAWKKELGELIGKGRSNAKRTYPSGRRRSHQRWPRRGSARRLHSLWSLMVEHGRVLSVWMALKLARRVKNEASDGFDALFIAPKLMDIIQSFVFISKLKRALRQCQNFEEALL